MPYLNDLRTVSDKLKEFNYFPKYQWNYFSIIEKLKNLFRGGYQNIWRLCTYRKKSLYPGKPN
jgi:hypothetical protein